MGPRAVRAEVLEQVRRRKVTIHAIRGGCVERWRRRVRRGPSRGARGERGDVATAYVLRARRGRTVIPEAAGRRRRVGRRRAGLPDQLALVGSTRSDEHASSAFIPFVWSSSSEGESGDGFWRAVRELWRRGVARRSRRCVSRRRIVQERMHRRRRVVGRRSDEDRTETRTRTFDWRDRDERGASSDRTRSAHCARSRCEERVKPRTRRRQQVSMLAQVSAEGNCACRIVRTVRVQKSD